MAMPREEILEKINQNYLLQEHSREEERAKFMKKLNNRMDKILKRTTTYNKKMTVAKWYSTCFEFPMGPRSDWDYVVAIHNMIREKLFTTDLLFIVHDNGLGLEIEFKDPKKFREKLIKQFNKACEKANSRIIYLYVNNYNQGNLGRDSILRNFEIVFKEYQYTITSHSSNKNYVQFRI